VPARWALGPLIGFDRRRHAIISLICLYFLWMMMPPLRVFAAEVSQDGTSAPRRVGKTAPRATSTWSKLK
jgi:hypothetical protein